MFILLGHYFQNLLNHQELQVAVVIQLQEDFVEKHKEFFRNSKDNNQNNNIMSRPKPLTEAEITFAEAVAMGKSYKTAAEIAGIKGYGSAACKIAERPKVAAYILQLSEEMKGKYQKYLEEGLPLLWQTAKEQGTVNAIARALELIATINGDIKRKEETVQEGQKIEINYIAPAEEKEGE